MKIGLFGGSFDPVHRGHIAVALGALSEYVLDEVWFLPDLHPRGKTVGADYAQRIEMLRLATAEYDELVVDRLPMQREGRTHGADTVRELNSKYPHDHFILIIGMDVMVGFDKWHDQQYFVDNIEFIVVHRPGTGMGDFDAMLARLADTVRDSFRYSIFESQAGDVSSSEVRKALQTKTDVAIHLHADVLRYVNEHRLYLP